MTRAEQIPELIAALRRAHVSITEIARNVGVSRKQVHQWENGTMPGLWNGIDLLNYAERVLDK